MDTEEPQVVLVYLPVTGPSLTGIHKAQEYTYDVKYNDQLLSIFFN